MELENRFHVALPISQTWNTLTDIEFIAPCMPGAQLTEVDGDEFKGQVKIKVGPITAQYKGSARFVEKDEASHTATIEASGRDSRGAGNAAALVTAQMTEAGDGTDVVITTDMKITGKVAQFGRGVMGDVTEKLIGQFVSALEAKLEASGGDGSAGSAASGAGMSAGTSNGARPHTETMSDPGTARTINSTEPEPVDLLDTAGTPILKRLLPAIGGLLLVFWLFRRRRKRG